MIETRRITIDIDLTRNKRKLLDQLAIVQRLLNNLKPCQARVSSSKKGIHVQKFYDKILYDYEGWEIYEKYCHPLVWCEEIFDDPKRKKLREIRVKEGGYTPDNILFDVKSFRGIILKAGEWYEIQESYDVELFLDFFLDFWRL
jgi:hypothetical protein